MVRLDIRYNAIDQHHSDQNQSFIGYDANDCWNQKNEFDKWLGRDYTTGIQSIYDWEIIKIEEIKTKFEC